jgi:hypothetical protein
VARLSVGTSKIYRDMHIAVAMIAVIKKMDNAHCVSLPAG